MAVEKDSCRNQPWSQQGQKKHIMVEATQTDGGRRELGVSEKKPRRSDPQKSLQALQQGG